MVGLKGRRLAKSPQGPSVLSRTPLSEPPSSADGSPIPNGRATQDVLRHRRLGDVLVECRMITSSQLEEALLQQPASGQRLGEILVGMGAIAERDLVNALDPLRHARR